MLSAKNNIVFTIIIRFMAVFADSAENELVRDRHPLSKAGHLIILYARYLAITTVIVRK